MDSFPIGVLGGSFNPIHNGHIELARRAHEQYHIPLIMLMPTSKPYYKDGSDYAEVRHRLQMAELAAAECGSSFMKSSSLDLDRGGITYTCDTIDELKELYDEIFFIVGSDSLMYIDKWKNAEHFLKKCIILYGKREGDTTEDTEKKAEYIRKKFHADVRELDTGYYPISSSEIRERIKKGKNISGLVPKSVEHYIKENNLYR